MATFAYYNPLTNTIERRHPASANRQYQYMPQLLNFQPEDLSYAAKVSTELRADPPFPKVPQPFQKKTQPVNRQLNFPSDDVETVKLTKKPLDEYGSSQPEHQDFSKRGGEAKPQFKLASKSSEPAPNEFLAIEDLTEEDLEQAPQYYEPPIDRTQAYHQQYSRHYDERRYNDGQSARYNYDEGYNHQADPHSYNQRRYDRKAATHHYNDGGEYGYGDRRTVPEGEADYNIVRPDKLTIHYKPEEFNLEEITKIPNFGPREPNDPEYKVLAYNPEALSMNERILNARFAGKEQEKTRKFIMKRIQNDINALEKFADGIETGLRDTEEQTKDLDARRKAMWEEVERKKFELRANELMKRIDIAMEPEPEPYDENRLQKLYKENETLFAEVDRVLAENNYAERSPDHTLRHIVEETEISEMSNNSRLIRASSGNMRGSSHLQYGSRSEYEGYDDYSQVSVPGGRSNNAVRGTAATGGGRYNLDQNLGRKNLVRMMSEDKTRYANRLNMRNPQRSDPARTGVNKRKIGYTYKKPAKINTTSNQNKGNVGTTETGYSGAFNSRNIENNLAQRRRTITVKNPKKVEQMLERAKQIADQY